MGKYVIDKNKNRTFAHARRLSNDSINKEDVIATTDGKYVYAIQVDDELTKENPIVEMSGKTGKGIVEGKSIMEGKSIIKPSVENKFTGRILIVDTLPE